MNAATDASAVGEMGGRMRRDVSEAFISLTPKGGEGVRNADYERDPECAGAGGAVAMALSMRR